MRCNAMARGRSVSPLVRQRAPQVLQDFRHYVRQRSDQPRSLVEALLAESSMQNVEAETLADFDILILDKPASQRAAREYPTVFANAPTAGVRLDRRIKDDSNALAEIVAREDVAAALGLNEGGE